MKDQPGQPSAPPREKAPVSAAGGSPNYGAMPVESLLKLLHSSAGGISSYEAAARLRSFGENRLKGHRRSTGWLLLLRQFSSPLTLILIAAAVLSAFFHEITDACLIIAIVVASALLGFWQEKLAGDALGRLLASVSTKTTVIRDQIPSEIPSEQIVPGDVVRLSAGTMVPGDCRLLEARDLFVNEAALTGETFPVEKAPGTVTSEANLGQLTNCLFYGTHVVSGTAQAIVFQTARQSRYGKIAQQLELRAPETDFERGVRRFGYFLMEVTLLLVLGIFAANVAFQRPVLDSFLFSLALAVGLTPQLLPAIISVNLAHGAKLMADKGVIVRRLASIENFGSMTVLCSDKTGTLTEGIVSIREATDSAGTPSERVLHLACLNAAFETGFTNPIDEVIRGSQKADLTGYQKLDEIPYDFVRKRLSILLREPSGKHVLITKGAVVSILECCDTAELSAGEQRSIGTVRAEIDRQYADLSVQGFRTLGVAWKDLGDQTRVGKDDETRMIFAGLISLHDPVKVGIEQTLKDLNGLGVSLKMISGDNRLIAAHVAEQVGLNPQRLLTGKDLREMSEQALLHDVLLTDVFAEVEPPQKERIILALGKCGQVVGYLGDGVNDVTALHAADVGISVDQAVDVAKEAADLVLLKHDMQFLLDGVRQGRATLANTLKYVYMATSANFGNMFSMAGASLFIPFLPLLPKQILLINLLTDFPEMTIARDRVDPELVTAPGRWNIREIRRFMLTFGPLSSVFDFLTFGILLSVPNLSVAEFRSGWFVESIVSACLVVLVIRSRRPFWESRPSRMLAVTSMIIITAATLIPFSPLASSLGFSPLPVGVLCALASIIIGYVLAAEVTKYFYYPTSQRTPVRS